MIEMTQAEVDEAIVLAGATYELRSSGVRKLARAVRHLTARVDGLWADLGYRTQERNKALEEAADARSENARLAARQMPALRWVDGGDLMLGDIHLAYVVSVHPHKERDPAVRAWQGWLENGTACFGEWPTEAEARPAVEAAMRKALGAVR